MVTNPDNAPLAAFDLAGVSPEDASAFKDALAKAGYAPEVVEKIGQPAISDTSQSFKPDVLSGMTKLPSLSAERAGQMAQDLIAAGVPHEQVEAALKADGHTIEAAHEDTRTPEVREFDAAGLNGPASPNEYSITYPTEFTKDMPAAELAGLDEKLKASFFTARVPLTHADGLANALVASTKTYPQTPDARALYSQEQRTLLARLGHGEETMTLAAIVAKRFDPQTFNTLHAQGAFESAESIVNLARIGALDIHRERLAKPKS